MTQKTTSNLRVGEREITLLVERRKVRHVYLRLGPDLHLRIVIPEESDATPEEVLTRKRPWIERKVHELSEMTKVLTDGYVLISGRAVTIREHPSREPGTRLCGKVIHIYKPADIDRDRILSERLTRMTGNVVRRTIPRLARSMGVKHSGTSVNEMKGWRWGQCTKKGDLRFSNKLACLPEELAEYVMIHELAHLKHFDHSARFKQEIKRHCPDHRALEKRLRTYLK